MHLKHFVVSSTQIQILCIWNPNSHPVFWRHILNIWCDSVMRETRWWRETDACFVWAQIWIWEEDWTRCVWLKTKCFNHFPLASVCDYHQRTSEICVCLPRGLSPLAKNLSLRRLLSDLDWLYRVALKTLDGSFSSKHESLFSTTKRWSKGKLDISEFSGIHWLHTHLYGITERCSTSERSTDQRWRCRMYSSRVLISGRFFLEWDQRKQRQNGSQLGIGLDGDGICVPVPHQSVISILLILVIFALLVPQRDI